VGLRGKTIRAISRSPLHGKLEIDATGRVVAPGFIDLLSYNPNAYGVRYKLADGVTTNLAMHGAPGTGGDMGAWYRLYNRRRPVVNYGGTFLYNLARVELKVGINRAATAAQLGTLVSRAERAVEDGALGISMSLEYAPGITQEEVEAMMRVAHRHRVPMFFHVRYSSMETSKTNLDALREVLTLAKQYDVAIHIDHITSTGGTRSMPESLRLLKQARAEGVDVTACAYPYAYWASPLNSARWAGGWQRRFGIDFDDVQIAGSSVRLTPENFERHRRLGKLAVAYAIPEEDVVAAMSSPLVMIGSDAILEPGNNNHPRAAGTFTRVLRVYVREKRSLPLMDALEKMTLLPARRMQASAPAMRRKGRLQVGADADLVVFDPDKVGDCATVEHPNCFSVGMDYVLVAGQVVKDPGGFNERARPGEAILNWKKSP
ncbi:MAG TPA: amidohydrolase family protein, partial [Terriglobia bacterium]|nr:amidohydrolase family protein [Terriglobia bacterium]